MVTAFMIKCYLQTDDGRKITRNYNKMASVLLEYEASSCLFR